MLSHQYLENFRGIVREDVNVIADVFDRRLTNHDEHIEFLEQTVN